MTVQASAFKSAMTYEILLIVVIGGIGSVTGSCIGSFLFIAASEWWLRGLDNGKFLGISAPNLFKSGFRPVVFAVIIMAMVLFYRKGIMGDREFSPTRIAAFFKRLFRKRAK
jgi:branched-chain amino acid transport system permease protein